MVATDERLHSTLRAPTPNRLQKIGTADLVIGFTTHSVKPSLAAKLARQAVRGAKTYFPQLKTVIIHTDTGLSERTRQAVKAAGSAGVPVITSRYSGVMGKGGGIAAILHGAQQLNARATVILDSHTTDLSPEWIPALATLILKNRADLVKARYSWHPPDSALNDLLLYPFIRAVWKLKLHHPAAGDFAVSPQLASFILQQDVWGTEVNRFGFDIWLSTIAAIRGWRIAQAAVGEKPPRPSVSETQTMSRFTDTVGTMFRQLHLKYRRWQQPTHPIKVATFTEFSASTAPASIPEIDPAPLIETLTLGWMEYRRLWQRIMFPENLASVEYLASHPAESFHFPPNLWAKIAYDFAVVYNKGERDPDAVAKALYPLFMGRLASFAGEIAGLTAVGRAGTVAAQAVEFEDLLPYLDYRWEKYLPWVDSGEKR